MAESRVLAKAALISKSKAEIEVSKVKIDMASAHLKNAKDRFARAVERLEVQTQDMVALEKALENIRLMKFAITNHKEL